ncbi:MAG: hypothetical protein K6F76_07185 [Clostridiales bacterium]|nr:hypothetical protein [Clostridiales bacterium]
MKIDLYFFRLNISYPFAALLALALLFDNDGRISCCILAAALHEAAHIAAMLVFGNTRVNIDLRLLDFKITDTASHNRSDLQNMIISLTGPLINILMYFLFGKTGIWLILGEANLALGIFNAVPLLNFDGGRILYILLRRFFSEQVCAKILNVIAFAALLIMYNFAIGVIINTGYNFSLLIVCVYLTLLLIFKGEQCTPI